MKKFCTLLKKDLWTFCTHKVICAITLIPPFLAVIFRLVIDDPDLVLLTCGLFNMVLSSVYLHPLLIADEKARGTLPLLFRSGVDENLFIGAKAAASVIQDIITAMVIFLISGASLSLLPGYLLFNLLIMATLLPCGLITAVFAKEENDTHVLSTPVMCIFYIPPVFSAWTSIFNAASLFLPTGAVGLILPALSREYGYREVSLMQALALCLIWFAAGIFVLYIIYRKRRYFFISSDR